MKTYYVSWAIHLDADSPIEAARKALAIHRNSESVATVFTVANEDGTKPQVIDLGEKEPIG